MTTNESKCHWCNGHKHDESMLHCNRCNDKRLGNGAGSKYDPCPVCRERF